MIAVQKFAKRGLQMETNSFKKNLLDSAKILGKAALTASLQAGTVLGAKALYDSLFPRYEKKDINTIFGEFDYSRVENKLERTTCFFPCGQWQLQGYFYPCRRAKKMVVVCHGMHSGSDDYLPFIAYFVQNGFAVFSYDCQGTYASEGDSTVGMCTPLVNLDHALNFIKKDPQFSKYKLYLFGHSWGGYAVTSVLSLHKKIRGCAAVAPFNSGYTLFVEKGEQFAGSLKDKLVTGFPKDFLEVYQAKLFEDYAKLDAVKGINSTKIPVFIAHGTRDFVISFNHQSVISHRDEIRQDNVTYYIGTGSQAGHNTILHSERAVAYQKQVEKELKQLKKEYDRDLTPEEMAEFCESVDHALYSEVNEEMMQAIVDMFNQ